jgi:hypothetical protein
MVPVASVRWPSSSSSQDAEQQGLSRWESFLLFRLIESHFSISTISIPVISLNKFNWDWEKYFP